MPLHLMIHALGWTLIHSLWQIALICCLCGVIQVCFRNSHPRRRYVVCLIALLACVLFPVAEFTTRLMAIREAGGLATMHMTSQAADTLSRWIAFTEANLNACVSLWAIGVIFMGARMTSGLVWLHAMRRAGHRMPDLERRIAPFMARLNIRRDIMVRAVDHLTTPMTFATFRPVILVPVALLGQISPHYLDALLAHELAHIKRFDYCINILQGMVETLLFFHPGIWWLSRSVRHLREEIADDLAASALDDACVLAHALNELEQFQSSPHPLAQSAHGGALVSRIKRLVRPERRAISWKMTFPVIGLAATCLIAQAKPTHPHPVPAKAESVVAAATTSEATPIRAAALRSANVLVVDEDSGKVLVEKNADHIVPIASLTKLMTAMVILDARQNMSEAIQIDKADVDTLKHSTSRVPVGAKLPRREVLQLALMSSDNRAAKALARNYPGGLPAFQRAVQSKTRTLGMQHTTILEPTGLSPANTSTASDLIKMAEAAAKYPEISDVTTDSREIIKVKGRQVEYHNTNHFVGKKGWEILLSKTGYTVEAGRCMIMRLKSAGKRFTMVLLNADGSATRARDIMNIRKMLEKQG
ncbi:serine hydrolase [Burkholderiaceae bacterium DAT-1]|nr:serine hydrolase [Burkholderiaceae bacterium DAT-1]